MWFVAITALPQEEDLQEIVSKISSKRAECEAAQIQVADLKAAYEKAEREYKQHKEQINTVAEEADSIKVLKYLSNSVCIRTDPDQHKS